VEQFRLHRKIITCYRKNYFKKADDEIGAIDRVLFHFSTSLQRKIISGLSSLIAAKASSPLLACPHEFYFGGGSNMSFDR
jgi:hypothetical protein